jgi:hypothetical protein
MKKLDMYECIEPVICTRRIFNNSLPVSYLQPLYKRIAKQNGLDYQKANDLSKIEAIAEISINFN